MRTSSVYAFSLQPLIRSKQPTNSSVESRNLHTQLQALPPGSLKEGEAQAVPQFWGDAFIAAAADAFQHGAGERGRAGGGGYLGGDGGRRIKRVIRDFVEGHRTW